MGAIVAGVIAFHSTLLLGVDLRDLHGGGLGTMLSAHSTHDDLELESGCVGDAMLGSTLRYSLCFAPWMADADACLSAAELDMYMDLSACEAHSPDAVASVAMLDKRQADKVTPIDPEPLLEMAKQPEPEAPKPPELQPQQPQVQAPPPPPPPPPPPAPKRPMQIVETAKPDVEKEPDNAHLLAAHSSVAEKQTVARGAVMEPMVAKSKPEDLAAKQVPKEASVQEQTPDRPTGINKDAPDVPGSLAMRQAGAQTPSIIAQDQHTIGSSMGGLGPSAFDGLVPRKGDGSFEQQRKERSEIPRGQSGAGGGAPDVPNLKPTPEVLERALGGGSVDHVDDAAEADETALNAKKFVHASFFNRLARAVRQNWSPGTVLRRLDPTGQVYGFKTRVTGVRVSLTTTGAIARIVVVSPSGISALDDEAVRAFNAAGPFVNPPTVLADSDGLITFTFGFYFEASEPSSSWRVIRSM